jgi:hypothetical protein
MNATPTRILALDPGTNETAYIVWDGSTIHAKGILTNEQMLSLLKSGDLMPYQEAAIEMVASYGMAVGREVFETCLWVGRYIERCKAPHRLIYRKDVKLHLCNSPRAKDGNIRQALIDKHGKQGTAKNPGPLYGVTSHIIAALAVADYALATYKEQP